MRSGAITLALLFVTTIAAAGQSWPTDGQVFRDVYGQFDASRKSIQWDSTKESEPSPFEGHSFARTGEEMNVEILLRTEVDGRLYVATSAVPKDEPDGYECHSCVAAVGAAVYVISNNGWKLEASSPAAIYGGGWGHPPSGLDMRLCGPKTYCFVVEDEFSGQGYSDSSLKVFGPVGNSVRSLLSLAVGSDDAGAYDARGVDGPSVWKRMSASVRFLVNYSKPTQFFDVELIGVRRRCTRDRCVNTWRHLIYRYASGRYSPIKMADSPDL